MTHPPRILMWWTVVCALVVAAAVAVPVRHAATHHARLHPRAAAPNATPAADSGPSFAPAAASSPASAPAHALRPLSLLPPPARALLEELRRKRNPQQTVSVKQAEDIGMCKFVVQQDVDPDRLPEVIWTVTCRQTGCRCGSEGDFRCTQLTTEISVSYKNGVKNQMLYPNSGCICAAKDASDALSAVPQLDSRMRLRRQVDVIMQQLLFLLELLFGPEEMRRHLNTTQSSTRKRK